MEEGISLKMSKLQNLKKMTSFFFKDALLLQAGTLVSLGRELEVPIELQEAIWTMMKLTVSHLPELLIGRHFDQILMCCIYTVTKLTVSHRVLFNDIISAYIMLRISDQDE